MDAQLQLDAFQRQYDQLVSSHDELVAMGRSVSKDIEQLDMEMFGSTATGHAHPLTAKVEELIKKIDSSLETMLQVACPRLLQLKDCLQYHLLQQSANKVILCEPSIIQLHVAIFSHIYIDQGKMLINWQFN